MEQVQVKCWEEFEDRLLRLRSSDPRPTDLLFRGQSNACWKLRTTLERRIKDNLLDGEYRLVDKYYDCVQEIKPRVETFIEREWDKLDFSAWVGEDYENLLKKFLIQELPGYSYLTYLRHHRFPSPLLDWTKSPYIAAYFAFSDPSTTAKAIYVYSERICQGKIISQNEPGIIRFGPNVRSHKRHFFQQSQYTICIACRQAVPPGAPYEWYFASHEEVFKRNELEQDVLTKFTIPACERIKILKKLEQYNLNALSLFGSEEGLLEALSMRHFDFKSEQKARPGCEIVDAAR